MLRILAITVSIVGLLPSTAMAQIRSSAYVTGLSQPVAFVADPSAANVQYIVEQGGRIRVVLNGGLQPTDFLNLSAVISTGGERGLLGLVFSPDYATSGRFFVNFTNPQGHTVIARFKRSVGNALAADPATRFDFFWPDGNRFITQPFANHNGGSLVFGPDGYLYIALGDGGSGNDPFHLAQNPNSLLGKMLRLNVAVGDGDPEGYDIPSDNPFLDGLPVSALGEIWAFGLRNPWKFSFDDPTRGGTGALVVGDVGQGTWEEIDYEPAAQGGRNYGWRNREGAHDNVNIDFMNPPSAYLPLVDPIFEYNHTVGSSITGGYIYRGTALTSNFRGRYFFADFVAERVWSLGLSISPSTGEAVATNLVEHTAELGGSPTLGLISSFGVDAQGELYVVSWSNGSVLRILPDTARMNLETPVGGVVTQPFALAGWALDLAATSGTGVDTVHVWAYPNPGSGASPFFVGVASYGGPRPDVGAVFGGQFSSSGFGLTVQGLAVGTYQFVAHAHSSVTGTFDIARSVTVTISAPVSNPRTAIDTPVEGSSVFQKFLVAGWALDLGAPSGTGVDTVHVYAYPNPGSGASPLFLGVASYGGARPDVGAVFGPRFTNSAYGLTVSGLSPGLYQIVVFTRSTVSGSFNPISSTVRVVADPLMSVDAPAGSPPITPPFLVAGWALDRAAATGVGVDAVHVYVHPVAGGGPIFLGVATHGTARPDVGAVFGGQFTNSGFALTVGSLAPGLYDLVVYARSTVTGVFFARVVRITII